MHIVVALVVLVIIVIIIIIIIIIVLFIIITIISIIICDGSIKFLQVYQFFVSESGLEADSFDFMYSLFHIFILFHEFIIAYLY